MIDKKLEELEHEVLQLPTQSRAILAEKLIRSLEADQETEVESAWIQEVEQRYHEVMEGQVTPVDADTAFRKIRAQL